MTLDQRADFTALEQKAAEMLKGKSRTEQDQIIFELERNLKNGNTLRNDSTGKRII